MTQFVTYGVILLVFLSFVSAQEVPQLPDQPQQIVDRRDLVGTVGGTTASVSNALDQQNRFLAAEVSRQIRDMKDEVSTELKTYQDENFRIMDERVSGFIIDARTKLIIGGLGVMLIANAIIALFIQRNMRRYSYENYLEGKLDSTQLLDQEVSEYGESFDEMQNPEWYPQESQETMGQVYGQQQASQMTAMNEWQTQPAYKGAWESPIEAQPEFSYYPEGHQPKEEVPKPIDTEDPLDSPGWSPGV